MARKPWRKRLHQTANACVILGALLLLLSLTSLICVPIYQQPPGFPAPPAPVGPGPAPAVPITTNPAGKIRVRFLAGSLIIANGDLPFPVLAQGSVKVTLGYMSKPGMTWFIDSPARVWESLSGATTWHYHFYKQHVQIQFFPIALALIALWALQRRFLPAHPTWACQHCGYDLRAAPNAPCPECGKPAAA